MKERSVQDYVHSAMPSTTALPPPWVATFVSSYLLPKMVC